MTTAKKKKSKTSSKVALTHNFTSYGIGVFALLSLIFLTVIVIKYL